jgi:RNA 2',3'-cyclic 3'-phosphodiesterase
MAKRLFLSIPLSEFFLNTCEAFQKKHDVKGVRWVSRENLHITVYFLGDIDEAHFPQAVDILDRLMKEFHPFDLKFDKASFAPPGKKPRMIWAVFEHNSNYKRFVQKITEELSEFVRLEREKRDPIAHITLGRLKNYHVAKKLELLQPVVETPTLSVTHCHLVESQLLAHGAKYSIVETYHL